MKKGQSGEKCILYRSMTVGEGCDALHRTDRMPKDEPAHRGESLENIYANAFGFISRDYKFKVTPEGEI